MRVVSCYTWLRPAASLNVQNCIQIACVRIEEKTLHITLKSTCLDFLTWCVGKLAGSLPSYVSENVDREIISSQRNTPSCKTISVFETFWDMTGYMWSRACDLYLTFHKHASLPSYHARHVALLPFWLGADFHKWPWQSSVNSIGLIFHENHYESGSRSRPSTAITIRDSSIISVKYGSISHKHGGSPAPGMNNHNTLDPCREIPFDALT